MPKRITKTYPLEFKQSSATLAANSKESIQQVAAALGVHPTTLYGWVQKFHPKQPKEDGKKDDLYEEVKRLRKENIRLKEERDILKKAAAYFASEM
jgi:transposase